jgi:hypothetical protein
MKIIQVLLSLIVLFYSSQLSHSADQQGRFYLGGGAGGVNCPQFVASMEKGRSFGVGSIGFVKETQGYTMYLLGFQTGYNSAANNTYDIFPDVKSEYNLLSWLENYCRDNPSDRFGDAVVSLSREQYSTRQKDYIK